MIDLSKYRIHDLTLPYDERIVGYSSSPAKTIKNDGWNATWLNIYSHAGTHMDAPLHFDVSTKSIDQYTPQDLMGRAWLVPITINESRQLLTPADLGPVKAQVSEGDILLLRTGWSGHLATEAYKAELPRISEELAKWCVARKIKMLGVEPPSVADVNDLQEVTHIHEILMDGSVIIVEGLTGLDKITSATVFFMALPLKIKDGDGAPARAIAFEQIGS